MSFGFIFAIILIIIFVLVAIWGINYFLDLNKCSNIGLSYDELQKTVATAYQSSNYRNQIQLSFPGVEMLCFANLSAPITHSLQIYEDIQVYDLQEANTYLYPSTKSCNIPYKNIKYLNLSEIVKNRNPYCVDANSKIEIIFDPETTDRGVVIKEVLG